jgi:integrase
VIDLAWSPPPQGAAATVACIDRTDDQQVSPGRRPQVRSRGEGSIQRVEGRDGYRAQLTLPDGRRPVKQFKTKQQAADWLSAQRALADAGQLVAPSTLRLCDWMDEWLAHRHRAPNTVAQELSHWSTHFNSIRVVRLDRLTVQVCRRWLEELDQHLRAARPPLGQPHTLRHCYNLLRTALNGAVEHRLIASNPMATLPRPKVPKPSPKFLTEDEVKRLLAAVNATGDPRAIAVHLMLRLGLRRGEALGLVWGDVDFDSGAISVTHQLQRVPDQADPATSRLARVAPKTEGSIRTLVADSHLLEFLRVVRCTSIYPAGPQDLLVTLREGVPVDPDAMTSWLRTIGLSIGVVCTPHRLRHTSATMMLNHNVAITTVGAVLGHSDIRTTGVYARVLDDTKSGAIETLGEALGRI